MELRQQLENWEIQAAEASDDDRADMEVAKRLLKHGIEALAEIERLRTGHQRYETARRMNPRQWADAWKLNTTTGKPFDEIIDDMRPFMVPNVKVRGRPLLGDPS